MGIGEMLGVLVALILLIEIIITGIFTVKWLVKPNIERFKPAAFFAISTVVTFFFIVIGFNLVTMLTTEPVDKAKITQE